MKTFRIGGVHPEENKITADKQIQYPLLPTKVYIPISQSLGAPSKLIVEKGTQVKVGQLIAKGEAFISSNVHSSVSGKVSKVDDVTDASGYRRPAVFIDVEGDEWEESIDRSSTLVSEITLTREQIVERINSHGIVGLGGAAFPTHVKLMVPKDKKVDALIINGVECEPYLTADHRVMLEKGAEVIAGMQVLMFAMNIKKAYIGIENNKPDAIANLTKLSAGFPQIEVVPLKVKYPQGGEKQLIAAISKREVPAGKLPIEIGYVVVNAGTTLAVYEAVQKNKPLVDRVVTVTGLSLSNASNYMVRIGTPVEYLIEQAGGLPTDTGKVISGGPMMGKALTSLDVPVVKGTSGILVMPDTKTKRVAMFNCIRCARCISVCPIGLEPAYLAQVSENKMFDEGEKAHIMDCIECGSCQYTCPAGRPILDHIRLGKNRVGTIMRNRIK